MVTRTNFFHCIILPCFRAYSYHLGCCRVQISSCGKGKEHEGVMPRFLIFRPRSDTDILCSYSVGKNLIIWPQLTARKAGNCKIAGQSSAQEEILMDNCHSLPLFKTFVTFIACSKIPGI